MIPRETLEKIRAAIKRIEITTRKVVDESLAGQYHSVFKGRGMEFDSVREYVAGDDIRSIDWNVSARMGRPYTKQYAEERELTVMLAVDASASMNFGSHEEFKNERAALISALIAFSAIKNNDRVGLVIFTGDIEHHIPPKKGRQHVLRLVRDVLFYTPKQRNSNVANATEYLSRTLKRKSVIFMISDFLDTGFQKKMQILENRHDVVAVQITDPRELEFNKAGIIRMEDPETGRTQVVDTSSRKWREQYSQQMENHQNSLGKFFKSNRIDHIAIHTDQPYDAEIIKFFQRRAALMR